MDIASLAKKALTILGKIVRIILMVFGIIMLLSVVFMIYSVTHMYRDEELEKDDVIQTIKYGGIIQDNDTEEILYTRRTGRSMGQDPYITNAVIVRMKQGVIEKLRSQTTYSGSNLSIQKDWNYQSHECFRPITKDSDQNPEFIELLKTADDWSPEKYSRLTLIESPKGNHSFLLDTKTRLAVICKMYYGEGSPWSE